MKRRGWSTTDDAFDVRRKLAIAATIPIIDPGWEPIPKPPTPEQSTVVDTPVPMRRGKRIDPIAAKKARKR